MEGKALEKESKGSKRCKNHQKSSKYQENHQFGMDLDDLRGGSGGWRGGLRGVWRVRFWHSKNQENSSSWPVQAKRAGSLSKSKEELAYTKELQGRYALQIPISGSKGLRKYGWARNRENLEKPGQE